MQVFGFGFDWNQPYSCSGWAQTFGITYPMIDDSQGTGWNQFGMGYIPHNVIIDHNNVVQYTDFGFDQTTIVNTIQQLLTIMNESPFISYQSYNLDLISDDGDGILNPGEGAEMTVILSNTDWASDASDVTAALSSNHPDITITDGTATYPDIPSGGTAVNFSDKFEFSINSDAVPGEIPITLTVTVGEDGSYETEMEIIIDVTLNQVGFPYEVGNTVQTAPVIVDIDGEGSNEVIAGSDDGKLYVLNSDGTLKWSYSAENKISSSPAIGDVNNDGSLEIVFGSEDMSVYVVDSNGSLQLRYNAGGFVVGTPALKDLDNNGDLEIIFGTFTKDIIVIHHDGTNYGSFPVNIDESIMTAAAVGDIDNNGLSDIIVGTWSDNVWAIDEEGNTLSGFPFSVGDRINSDPALADLSGNSNLEIIVGSDDAHVYAIRSDGSIHFDYETGGSVKSSPAIVELEGSVWLPVIFFGSSDDNLYGIDHEGNDLFGWPVELSNDVQTSPSMLDLDNDGEFEIVVGTSGGNLFAFNTQGEIISNFPVNVGSQTGKGLCIGDLDNDGNVELAVGTVNAIEVIDVKTDMGSGHSWNLYRGNLHRTGNFYDINLGIDDELITVPETFALYQNYPNPFNPVTTIRFDVPVETTGSVVLGRRTTETSLQIYDVMGRLVETLVSGRMVPGTHSVEWDASDAATGVYIYRLITPAFVESRKLILLK